MIYDLASPISHELFEYFLVNFYHIIMKTIYYMPIIDITYLSLKYFSGQLKKSIICHLSYYLLSFSLKSNS